jgi:hypothetical protein
LFVYVAATFGVAVTGTVQGAVIYSQVTPAQPVGAFTSTDSDSPTAQKIADNLLLATGAPTTVRSIFFIGGYTATMPPPITPPLDSLPADKFRVLFLSDVGGSPGTLIAGGDFAVGAPVRRTPTGGSLLNGIDNPIAYTLNLIGGFTLNPNTVYWVSLLNDPGPSYAWAWARATGSYDQQDAATYGDPRTGPWDVNTDGGMYFGLSDANVPEPACSTILMVGVFAVSAVRASRCWRSPCRV